MKSYQEMSKEELLQEKESLKAAYKEYQKMDLSLNMARGKPAVGYGHGYFRRTGF